MFSFAEKTLSGLRPVMKGTTKKIAESTKCDICSFISLSKNKVFIFEKTSADLARIIRLSMEIDVNKYSEDSKLFVRRECFQQLTKYERAAKKLQEIKQELLSTCINREQLREKRTRRGRTIQRRTTLEMCQLVPPCSLKLHMLISILSVVFLIVI